MFGMFFLFLIIFMKFRSALLGITGALLLVSAPALAATYGRFWDTQGTPYQSAIERMVNLGVMNGYNNGSFGTNDMLTRGQMALILDRYDQNVIEPLRRQMGYDGSNYHSSAYYCGNGRLESGEQCDDGNLRNGDGCNASCRREYSNTYGRCAGGYNVGDVYKASDGCNSCTCMDTGEIICTNYRCSGSSTYETSYNCTDERNDYEDAIDEYDHCSRDSDCTVFSASCPYLTCGEAINEDDEDRVRDAADEYISCKQRRGDPMTCASCSSQRVACVSGRCVLR